MKRVLPAVLLVALLLAAGLFWATRAADPGVPAEPRPAPEPVAAPVPAPEPSGRTVYHFRPPGSEDPEDPAEPDAEDPAPSVALPREVMNDFAYASNEATGKMWNECVRPWREEHEVPDAPLTVNLVLQDGRVGDVEIISPYRLTDEVVACMEDAVWSVPFPEHEPHRGTLRLQRTLNLTR
ncbi:MAG: hypothetical protein R3F61_00160 [Myxococcota bacterium]